MFGGHKREKQCTCLKSDLCSPKMDLSLTASQLSVSNHLLFYFHVHVTVSAMVTLKPAAFSFFRFLLIGQNTGMTLGHCSMMEIYERRKVKLSSGEQE